MGVLPTMQNINLLPHMAHYWDESNHIPVPQIPLTKSFKKDEALGVAGAMLASTQFNTLKTTAREYTLGQASSNHWLQFCLTNPTDLPLALVLVAAPSGLTEIDFYPLKAGMQSFQTGGSKAVNTRDIFAPTFDFNIQLAPLETQHFYLRINSHTGTYLTAAVWTKPDYFEAKDKVESLDGIIAGVWLGLILYTLLLYLSVRESSSLLYIAWSISTLVFVSSIDGRILQYLIPNRPSLAYLIVVFTYPLSLVLSALFAQQFIRLKDVPRLNLVGNLGLLGFVGLLLISYAFGPSVYYKVCAVFLVFVVSFFGLIAPLYGVIKLNSRRSKYYLIALSPLATCALDRSIFIMGWTSQQIIPYEPKVGIVAAAVLFAYFVSLMAYQEKAAAQQQALKQLQISNDLKSTYNAELESEIKRNTLEISTINSDLERQATQLTELNEAKSIFFANISHEFRTPLTLIQGPLVQLQENGWNESKGQKVIHDAIQHSKSLQRLIDQLLTLSKFDADSLSLKASITNVTDASRAIFSQFASLAEDKGIELIFESKTPTLEAFVDQEKLQIILNNLINNALKFTKRGGRINLLIDANLSQDATNDEYSTDQYVTIVVSDTGQGIPESDLDFVFDRFYQSQSSDQMNAGNGTGIGLALVKELVSMHAGNISVSSKHRSKSESHQSTETTGTCFRVNLPLGSAHLNANEIVEQPNGLMISARQATEAVAKPNPENSEKTKSKPIDGKTVLIVDDNDGMRAYIRSVLEPFCCVIEAVDGIDGEAVLNQQRPDIIITDLMMPKRDGLQFVEAIKSKPEFINIPIIMLTAKAGQKNRLKGLLAAVDDYIIKPFDAHELVLRVRDLLIKQAQFKAFYQTEREDGSGGIKVTSEDKFLSKLRSVVEEGLSNAEFGVNQLAHEMHVSKATLGRKLAANYHFSAAEFIRQCRLEKARELSQGGTIRSTAELANAVGFNHTSYFSRLYKKAFNQAPLDNT